MLSLNAGEVIFSIINIIIFIATTAITIYIIILLIKSLRKYLRTPESRKEKELPKMSLGEVLKEYRIVNKMTQEYVAESLGVSRQAVSKWENGTSEPSTSNLIALSKLYDVPVEDLLRRVS